MPADESAIPAGSAQAVDDVRPVTVVVTGNATQAAPLAAIAAHTLRSLPVPQLYLPDERGRRARPVRFAAAGHQGQTHLYPRPSPMPRAPLMATVPLVIARAETVRAAFVGNGVDLRKLKVTYRTTCFVAPNDTEAGCSANRRVEIELMMPAAQP